MALAAGSRLGPYEVRSLLGAGGMGEVYRAIDTRLGRDVAIKVLPEIVSKDSHALSRFEHEAKAVAALSHPNIVALHDVGETNGIRYAVTELLEGENLRALISRGPLPVRRALEIAEQVAQGLAAAHGKGIVHRDVKPENVFVAKDGHVKILDFGLARPLAVSAGGDETESPTVEKLTSEGAVVGTVAYMSPEQARGLPVDHRSDQFSLGIVLYEMLAGRRPFKGASAAETLTAIIREEPEPLSEKVPPVPAPVRWIVERCLSKEPGERYDSTRDLARELSNCRSHLSEAASGAVEALLPSATHRRRRAAFVSLLAFGLVGLGFAGAFALLRSSTKPSEPKFQRLTFKRGYVTGARFAPDGQTVVYSAAWDGELPAVYNIRLDALDAVPSGYQGANLLAISPKSQLALSLVTSPPHAWYPYGILALAPFAGGAPRELDREISFADFSRDGEIQALIRGRPTEPVCLEWPPRKILYRPAAPGYASHVRISPSGAHVAFLDQGMRGGNDGDVVILDRSGKILQRKGPFVLYLEGLAWSPRGDEVWFGADSGLRAVRLDGRERVVFSSPVPLELQDVSSDGRVLASTFEHRIRLFYQNEPLAVERELSALANSMVVAISPDGKWVAFVDDSLGGVFQCYLRSASGAPPVRLGPGVPGTFTPDSRALVVIQPDAPAVILQPVGQGEPTVIPLEGFQFSPAYRIAGLSRDGKSIWFKGNQPSRPERIWRVALSGGKPVPITEEGVGGWVTDDGTSVVFSRSGRQRIRPIAGGEERPVEGLLEGELAAAWTEDGKPLFVFKPFESLARIYRLDAKTGTREFFREIAPADRTGVQGLALLMTPDGKASAYQVFQLLTELHLIEGLR